MGTDVTGSAVVDTDKDYGTGASQQLYNKWNSEIKNYETHFRKWNERADKIRQMYRADSNDDEKTDRSTRMYTLWSNLETLKPSVFAQNPTMEIERRYGDQDPVGRVAARILDRALNVTMDDTDFIDEMVFARDEYLLSGRGIAWIRYTADTITEDEKNEETGEVVQVEELASEEVQVEYLDRKNFLHTPSERWKDVWWVARRVPMTFAALSKRFGKEKAEIIKAAEDESNKLGSENKPKDTKRRSEVFEIWDKQKRKVYWFSKAFKNGVLDERDDLYNLRDFFPCPKPLFATRTADTLVPVPDYVYYQDLSLELDRTMSKIALLTKSLRVLGFYDGSKDDDLSKLLDGSETSNKLVPVKGYGDLLSSGGARGIVTFMPLSEVVTTIRELQNAKEQYKADIAEITGISDIIRGQGKASETATAQRIKGQFATLRLDSRQKTMAVFVRDTLRIVAEIISEQFEPQTIMAMAGTEQMTPEEQTHVPAALALLQNDVTRTFRIDIETDSTIGVDKEIEKQSRIEMMTSVGGFMQQAVPLAQEVPELAPLMGQLLTFAVRSFDAGRPLEASFEEAVAQLEESQKRAAIQAEQAPPPQDPEVVKAEGEVQLAREKAQTDIQIQSQKNAAENLTNQQKNAADLQVQREKMNAEIQLKREQMALDQQFKLEQLAVEREVKLAQARMNAGVQAEKAELDASVKSEQVQLQAEIDMHKAERDEFRETIQSGILDEEPNDAE